MIDPAVPLGAVVVEGGVSFTVWAPDAERLDLILCDGEAERVLPFEATGDGLHRLLVPGIGTGQAYRLARGEQRLVDPYALVLDRPYGKELPCAIVTRPKPTPPHKPTFRPGGAIYELAVKPFTILHPDVPEADRGTLRGLAHPAVIAHLQRIGVDAVELMPIVAWIDERHLHPLGLTNGWGYNPVTFMPIDPRLGTLADLRASVAALHEAGIDVILDLVFNHSGESDIFGQTLSFRGLADRAYYRHAPDGSLVNDTGCGNTVACDHPVMRRMILDTLRHFVTYAGVDGFRFDLAPILGRTMEGFSAQATLLEELRADPLLADRILIAEPWDIGPGGYQLGRFPPPFLEWSDRYRDDMRRFWRGDRGTIGALATRLSASSDIFGGETSRTVNFLAAHDGFTLADLVAYEARHNEANGEDNRDGHGENFSWNNGAEGATENPDILAARRSDAKALLATLYASRGTIMLTAGDEFGRSQRGNNNAYCQDNAITWIDWSARDEELEAFVAELARLRRAYPELSDPAFLREGEVQWLTEAGEPMTVADWEDPDRATLEMRVGRVRVLINRSEKMTGLTTTMVPPRSVLIQHIQQEPEP
ncbi:MAG TPA: glycogen debranching protein GlgX [Sphingobium sp.]|uniref:glycogen debranching protein GlgX n=1 Tax=Sphingobium sp. TaxID=1912891 RepID=UPI002ED37BBF